MKKSFAVIHPLGLAEPTQPGGPEEIKWDWKRFLGKTNIGGIVLPDALIATAKVTSVPFSPDVTDPTCFAPLLAITLSGHCTVVIPVSSVFQISEHSNL